VLKHILRDYITIRINNNIFFDYVMVKNFQRIEKSTLELLSDLDDHMRLLKLNLTHLKEDSAHIKTIAAELRLLICISCGKEGLLWRMVEKLKVSDIVFLQIAGNINKNHPLAVDLNFVFVPIQRVGYGHPRLPERNLSLKKIIRIHEAVYIDGDGLTHEYLIKAISQQMGSAHEDDSVDIPLDKLKKIFINGIQPYVQTLSFDSELVLQIGERVLNSAEDNSSLKFKRKIRHQDYGDLTIVLRMGYFYKPQNKIMIVSFQSFISEVEFVFSLNNEHIICEVIKSGKENKEIRIKHPSNWLPREDIVITMSYSSRARKINFMLNGVCQNVEISCDAGWIYAEDIKPTNVPTGDNYPVYIQFLRTYCYVITSQEAKGFFNI
jgi:hypothetical protein